MKRKDGYVLVYVMVVIVLLCTLAAIVCSVALQNLKAQNASLERTQDLYTAEGLAEQFVGQVQQYSENKVDKTEYEDEDSAKEAAKSAAETEFQNKLKEYAADLTSMTASPVEWTTGQEGLCTANIETTGGNIRLQAKIEITFQVKVEVTKVENSSDDPEPEEPKEPEGSEDPEDPEEPQKYSYSYTASVVPPIKYVTYETSSAGETTDGGEAP